MSAEETVGNVIAEALVYALEEHGLDDMGFSVGWAAGIVEEALVEAEYAVIKLPEQVDELEWGDLDGEWATWKRYGSDLVACRAESPLHPEDAKAFAAALVAAAVSLPIETPTGDTNE